VLLGPGVTATNITYVGAPAAIGFFNGVSSNIGLDSGIVMTSGSIQNAPGPNLQSGITTDNQLNGDPDLDNIMSPTSSWDASVLQFDFVPTGDTVKFRYVFASDEYPEYANTSINDGFGFFLSGVSTPMPVTNIALIPSSTTPVTINSVNCQNNSPYYVCNDPSNFTCGPTYTCPGTSGATTVEYDGFTTVLTAISPVICGETYHIKIAIADGSDHVLDSGVFLEAGSFSSTQVQVTTQFSYGGPSDSTLYEGCGQACLIFSRHGNLTLGDTVMVNVSGSATTGVDFTAPPSTVIFQPGQDTVIVCLQAAQDNITEGLETVIISAQPVGASICVQSGNVGIMYIGDYVPLSANITGNSPVCPGGNAILTANVTGGAEPYLYDWSSTATDTSSLYLVPTQTTTYSVNVTDPCNSTGVNASFQVVVLPQLQLQNIEDQEICTGNTVTIVPQTSGGSPAFYYVWSTIAGMDSLQGNPNGSAFLAPTGPGTYQVTIYDNCNNSVTDQFSVDVVEVCDVYVPNVFTPNGDQSNDNFVVKNLDHFPNSSLFVYNRWGSKVFESANYQNDWNGSGMPEGVYYYLLNLPDGKEYHGFVTLIR
jgi:gliding motility-associated-like protein